MSKKYQIILNYLGFFVLACSGLLVNLLISLFSSVKYLGIFNISYAIFIGLSQLCTFGFHISTLRYSVKFPKKRRSILTVSLLSVLGISFVMGLFLVLMSDFFAVFWDEKLATANLKYIALATAAFSMNKVMMWALNAKEDMNAYAYFQIMRGVGVLGCCLLFVFAIEFPSHLLFVCVLIGEALVAAVLGAYCWRTIGFGAFSGRLFRLLFSYSKKSVPVGLIGEVNLKVDVLCAGYFLNDSLVGAYSFMAMFVEGLLSSMTVPKNFINPKIAAMSGSISKIIDLQKKYRAYLTGYGVAMAIFIWLFYLGYLHFTKVSSVYHEYAYVLVVLVTTPALLASLWPFDQVFVYKGFPNVQTAYLSVILGTNLTLNLLLIPLISLWGAAAATGFSMLVGQAYFNYKMKEKFGRSFVLPP